MKGQYRKFNIRADDLAPGDDYAMMREVLTRRYSRLKREEDGEAPEAMTRDDDLPNRPGPYSYRRRPGAAFGRGGGAEGPWP